MDLTKILSISGKPDLFTHIAQSKNGMIVESLVDGKRLNAFASMRVSALHEIAIYTEGEDMPLEDVFKRIFKKEDGGQAISHKVSSKELKKYFGGVLPEYDEERVYVSDIKRLIKWYNLLQSKGLIDLEENEDDKKEEENKAEVDKTEDVKETKTKTKEKVKEKTKEKSKESKKKDNKKE